MVVLAGCVATEPVGDSPDSGTESGQADGDAGDDDDDDDGSVADDDDDDTDGSEQEHVVLLECASPSCDTLEYVIDVQNPEALACAQAFFDEPSSALLRVTYRPDGAPHTFIDREEAYLLLARTEQTIRQVRTRAIICDDEEVCEPDPWTSWGPHELCDVSQEFHPDGNVENCAAIEDWTCEEVDDELFGG